jgi:Family of unknown function (DUF6186)
MSRDVTLVGYAVLAMAAVGLAVAARRRAFGTFGDALTFAMQHRPARFAALAGWLWLGWHLFVRVHWH